MLSPTEKKIRVFNLIDKGCTLKKWIKLVYTDEMASANDLADFIVSIKQVEHVHQKDIEIGYWPMVAKVHECLN